LLKIVTCDKLKTLTMMIMGLIVTSLHKNNCFLVSINYFIFHFSKLKYILLVNHNFSMITKRRKRKFNTTFFQKMSIKSFVS
jgi:hypothetical protein